MSLVEVLVAALIMVVVALGLIPLFARSMRQNREGANFMDLTNVARSALEEHLQMDFAAPRLTIPAGSDELVVQQYWDSATDQWLPLPADLNTLPATAEFERTIQIQQFASGDLILDGTLDDPLAGDVPADLVQLKRIRVMVRALTVAGREYVAGRPTPVALEVLKAV
jgi:type II secretory pathway pseudopilin PulG